jgi:hypothetical protein
MKSLSKFLAFTLLVCGVNTVRAQNSLKDDEAKKAAEVKTLVNSGRYTFSAEKVHTKGETQSAGYGTVLDISKDTLIAYLPDLGKDPGSPVSAKAPGITCIHFAYKMTQASDSSYDVSIVPEEKYVKDLRNIKDIDIHISKIGYADVKVSTTNHGELKYHGYIMQHEAMFPGAKSVVSNY